MGEVVKKHFMNPTLLRSIRIVRICRILRLVKGAKGVRTLLFALFISLPALLNIGLLLLLVMFIYAILGMSFFGYVIYDAGINELFNFETFFHSMLLLFQMSTTAGWADVLKALSNQNPPDCDITIVNSSGRGNCGSIAIAVPFLVSYIFISSFIMMNMYIAVIMENYNQAREEVQNGLTDDDYDIFYEIWQKYDPEGTQFVQLRFLSDILDQLQSPLRIPYPNYPMIVALNIPIYEDYSVYCKDVLDLLTRSILQPITMAGHNSFITANQIVDDNSATVTTTSNNGCLSSQKMQKRRILTTTLYLQRKAYHGRVILNAVRKFANSRQKKANLRG